MFDKIPQERREQVVSFQDFLNLYKLSKEFS